MTALVLSALLAQSPAYDKAERDRAQNRLVSDLSVHTVAAASCAQSIRFPGEGTRCWLWAFALELGAARDFRGTRSGTSLFVGSQPLAFGSWFFRDQHRFTDVEFGFIEPFATFKVGQVDGAPDRFASLTIGSRSWVGWAPLRAGVEFSYEFSTGELSRGFAFSLFVALAWHYAPLRGDPRKAEVSPANR